MTRPTSVLVVANVTAASQELVEALRTRTRQGPLQLTLLIPATGPGRHGREAARPRLEAALAAWRDAGLEADGMVGDEDPLEAVLEVWNPREYDEIVVATLPASTSRWLRCDLPSRLMRATDAQVTHVPTGASPQPPERQRGRIRAGAQT